MSSVWRKSSKRASARSATQATHSDQASRAAARGLNPPPPWPWFLVPSVTTPLYTTTISLASEKPLGARRSSWRAGNTLVLWPLLEVLPAFLDGGHWIPSMGRHAADGMDEALG